MLTFFKEYVMRTKGMLLLFLSVVFCSGVCIGGDIDNDMCWEPKVKSVAVFKNGLGFFTRQADVSLRDGWCQSGQIPPAAFGTLAIYSGQKEHLVDIVGSGKGEIVEFDGVDAADDVDTRRKRLEASINLKLQLTYKQKGSDRSAAGKLVSIGPKFAILESSNNSFAVPIAGISKMQVLELPLRVHIQGQGKKAPAKTSLHMAYLRKGITWIPEYSVEIIDKDTATLTLRGTLINEAEDLIHCDVNFVVGVPHFTHTGYMAPIAVGQTIRAIGASVAPAQFRNQIMNRAALVSNVASNGDGGIQFGGVVDQSVGNNGGNIDKAMGNLPRMDSSAGTDYTVYTKKDMTVRKGEKAIVTLFVKKIKYSHIYRWPLPARVKHYLVLHNDTDTAWTTGPYLAVHDGNPLSEDILKYTPKGGKCEITVTQAINISHDSSEAETARKLKAYNPRRDIYYDLVTLRGTLKLKNFEKRTADIIVTAPVKGKAITSSEGGTIKVDSTKLRLIERAGKVSWKISLEPGEETTLTYDYERYVSSH